MNICVFSRVNYWHGIQGGMDVHGKILSEGMVKRGNQVSIISTAHPYGREFEKRNGVDIYYLKDTVFGSRRKGWARKSILKFIELNHKRPFDVIWSQSFDAFGLASFNKSILDSSVVTILHGCMQQEFRTFITNISHKGAKETILALAGLFLTYFWIQRRVISYSDRIIAVSKEVSTSFEKWYGKRFTDKCVIIENGVDTTLYCPNEKYRTALRARYGVDDEDVLIMAMGRITKEKGFHIALEAVQHLVQQNMRIKFIIVGSGEYLDKLKVMVQKHDLKDHVLFTGFVENIDTVKYYNGCDIVLNPSLTAEGSQLVILEAMSCGKPVIASKVGGINSIVIDGRNGFLVEPGKARIISDKIKEIVNSKSLAQRISASARKTVLKKFTIDQMLTRTSVVMEEMAYKGLP